MRFKKYIPRKRILLLPLAVIVVIVVVILVFIRKDARLDTAVFEAIAPHTTPGRTQLMKFISFFGNHAFLIPANLLLVLLFVFRKEKWMAIKVGLVALSSLAWMSLIKNMVQRHRPSDPLVDGITNYSFPSGHAFMSVAFFGLLIYLAEEHVKAKTQRRFFTVFVVLLIMVIGFSRVYLRVHYTTDVLAGWCLGSLWLVTAIRLGNWLEEHYSGTGIK